ncbi:hypothetical protein BsWGS_26144 [Bradybaena similaris]
MDSRRRYNFFYKDEAEINAEFQNNRTPLHHSAEEGHEDVVEILLKAGANVNAEDENKITPLHCSVENGHKGVVEILLKAGANVNAQNDKQKAPLHVAVYRGHIEIVEMLLKADANVNAADDRNQTPLYYAAGNNNKEMVTTLLKAGANVNGVNDKRRTPLNDATHKDNQQGSSSADCVTLPSSAGSSNSREFISEDNKATTSALPFGLSRKKCEDIVRQVDEHWATFSLQDNSHKAQCSTDMTSVTKKGKTIYNFPVTIKIHKMIVQNYAQESLHVDVGHTEFLNVNSRVNLNRPDRADSDADTDDSDSNDKGLKKTDDGNVFFTISNTCYDQYDCIRIRR